jgi:hypothetical protein
LRGAGGVDGEPVAARAPSFFARGAAPTAICKNVAGKLGANTAAHRVRKFSCALERFRAAKTSAAVRCAALKSPSLPNGRALSGILIDFHFSEGGDPEFARVFLRFREGGARDAVEVGRERAKAGFTAEIAALRSRATQGRGKDAERAERGLTVATGGRAAGGLVAARVGCGVHAESGSRDRR